MLLLLTNSLLVLGTTVELDFVFRNLVRQSLVTSKSVVKRSIGQIISFSVVRFINSIILLVLRLNLLSPIAHLVAAKRVFGSDLQVIDVSVSFDLDFV